MRSQLLPLALVAIFGAATVAFAAETTEGMIKSFDMATHSLTLEDGTMYNLPADLKDPGFKVGEKVSVTWDKTGDSGNTNEMRDAVSVTIVE